MIYTDIQLKEKIMQMLESFESEVVEFKEAKTNYSFNDIGKYFSALSNEANIRGFQEAWLVFGISNDKKFTGTEFRKQGGLQSLKKELVNGTNERLTFLEIYELSMHKCRIIAFQIPRQSEAFLQHGRALLMRGSMNHYVRSQLIKLI